MAYRDYSVAYGHIVDAGGHGDFSTIAAALTAASSGQTIFIRPGTYTENLTLKAGVNLAAFTGDSLTPNVTIIGKLTFTAAGTVSISGIRLQTNSDFFLAVTGASSSKVNLRNCYLNCSNNTGISFTSSDATSLIQIDSCRGDIGTTGISLFTSSSAGELKLYWSEILNTGLSTTASTASAGTISFRFCRTMFPFSNSGTGSINATHTLINTESINTTSLTLGSSGNNSLTNLILRSGTASALSVGAGAAANVSQVDISSSNTNTITGLGTLNYALVSNPLSSGINTTTQTPHYVNIGKYRALGQPAFMAYLNTTVANATGDGTAYTVIFDTEVYDQGGDFNLGTSTFTAPVTGKYFLQFSCFLTGGTTITSANAKIVTSNRTYNNKMINGTGAVVDCSKTVTVIADMDAADTATFTVTASDGGGKIDDVSGLTSGELRTYCSGYLVC